MGSWPVSLAAEQGKQGHDKINARKDSKADRKRISIRNLPQYLAAERVAEIAAQRNESQLKSFLPQVDIRKSLARESDVGAGDADAAQQKGRHKGNRSAGIAKAHPTDRNANKNKGVPAGKAVDSVDDLAGQQGSGCADEFVGGHQHADPCGGEAHDIVTVHGQDKIPQRANRKRLKEG